MSSGGVVSPAWPAAWGSWLTITFICFFVWLVTGVGLANPWFLWIVGPWGLLMLGRWITGAPGHGHGPGGRSAAGFVRHLGPDPGRDRDRGRERRHGPDPNHPGRRGHTHGHSDWDDPGRG